MALGQVLTRLQSIADETTRPALPGVSCRWDEGSGLLKPDKQVFYGQEITQVPLLKRGDIQELVVHVRVCSARYL